MSLVPPSRNINNSKLYFSKSELSKILSCYSLGVSRGNWKDYAIDFTKDEAIFFIYNHSWAKPDCVLKKFKERKQERIIYKLSITNKNNSQFKNIDELITLLKRKQFRVI